ncbi:hypothetical protein BC828DRAFT_391581, partial [Blastocladiella britannica]
MRCMVKAVLPPQNHTNFLERMRPQSSLPARRGLQQQQPGNTDFVTREGSDPPPPRNRLVRSPSAGSAPPIPRRPSAQAEFNAPMVLEPRVAAPAPFVQLESPIFESTSFGSLITAAAPPLTVDPPTPSPTVTPNVLVQGPPSHITVPSPGGFPTMDDTLTPHATAIEMPPFSDVTPTNAAPAVTAPESFLETPTGSTVSETIMVPVRSVQPVNQEQQQQQQQQLHSVDPTPPPLPRREPMSHGEGSFNNPTPLSPVRRSAAAAAAATVSAAMAPLTMTRNDPMYIQPLAAPTSAGPQAHGLRADAGMSMGDLTNVSLHTLPGRSHQAPAAAAATVTSARSMAASKASMLSGPEELPHDAASLAEVVRSARAAHDCVSVVSVSVSPASTSVDGSSSFCTTPETALSSTETLNDHQAAASVTNGIKGKAEQMHHPGGGDDGGSSAPGIMTAPPRAPSHPVFRALLDMVVRVADVTLTVVYSATAAPQCNALVSAAAPGITAAASTLTVASCVGVMGMFLLFLELLGVSRATRSVGTRPGWIGAMTAAYTRRNREAMSIHRPFNSVKMRAMTGILLRDMTGLAVVVSQLGPRDINVTTIAKLVTSVWLLSRESANLGTVFWATIVPCWAGTNRRDRDYHRRTPVVALWWVVAALTAITTVTPPAAILLSRPDGIVRFVYVSQPLLPQIELSVVCVGDLGSSAVPAAVQCNRDLCGSGGAAPVVGSWSGWSLVHNRSMTFASIRTCTKATVQPKWATVVGDRVPASYSGLVASFPLPDGRGASYFADVPCAAPVVAYNEGGNSSSILGTLGRAAIERATPAAWGNSLVRGSAADTMRRFGGRSPFRASQLGPEADVGMYSAAYNGSVSAMATSNVTVRGAVAANAYLSTDPLVRLRDPTSGRLLTRSERAPARSGLPVECPRQWMFPITDTAAGERYMLSVRILHAELVSGPLSCTFNGLGLPRTAATGADAMGAGSGGFRTGASMAAVPRAAAK